MSSAPASSRWKKAGGSALSWSLLFHALLILAACLWAWKIIPVREERPPDFVSAGGGGGSREPSSVRVQASQRRNPAVAASSHRAITIDAESAIILQEPGDLPISGILPEVSISGGSAGSSTGGSGTGTDGGIGSGHGRGTGPGVSPGFFKGSPVVFFGQESKASRIAYVIDFSKSMAGRRQKLMRNELTKSITALTPAQQYQLIFFAGPVWVAGSKVTLADDQKSGVVTTEKGREQHWTSRSVGEWHCEERLPEPAWLYGDPESIQRAVPFIRDTPLVFGTDWRPAIQLALEMKPAPEVIYFMTDGIVKEKVGEVVDDLSRIAKRRKCVIHTIAMMEPDAEQAMFDLADKTGGSFTMIHPDGSVTAGRTTSN